MQSLGNQSVTHKMWWSVGKVAGVMINAGFLIRSSLIFLTGLWTT
jgi:hypothetical protein